MSYINAFIKGYNVYGDRDEEHQSKYTGTDKNIGVDDSRFKLFANFLRDPNTTNLGILQNMIDSENKPTISEAPQFPLSTSTQNINPTVANNISKAPTVAPPSITPNVVGGTFSNTPTTLATPQFPFKKKTVIPTNNPLTRIK